MSTVRSGLEVFLQEPPDVVRGRRIGLLSSAAAVDRDYRLSADLLVERGARPLPIGRGEGTATSARRRTKDEGRIRRSSFVLRLVPMALPCTYRL